MHRKHIQNTQHSYECSCKCAYVCTMHTCWLRVCLCISAHNTYRPYDIDHYNHENAVRPSLSFPPSIYRLIWTWSQKYGNRQSARWNWSSTIANKSACCECSLRVSMGLLTVFPFSNWMGDFEKFQTCFWFHYFENARQERPIQSNLDFYILKIALHSPVLLDITICVQVVGNGISWKTVNARE